MQSIQNKKQKHMAKVNWVVVILVAAVLVLAINPNLLSNLNFGAGSGAGTTVVTTSTALSFVAADAAQPGVSISPTSYIGVNGGNLKTGVTTASGGQVLEILLTNSSYHPLYIARRDVPFSATDTIDVVMNKNASLTITVFNTNNDVMTEGDGGVNQTVATGGSYNLPIRIDGTDKATTQDMRCVLESSDSTKVDKITLNGFGSKFVGLARPASYTVAAGSAVWVYDVTPIVGASSPSGTVSVTSKTGQSMADTTVKISCFTMDYFIDSQTGKVVYGIEDSVGTKKSINTYTATYWFQ